MSHQGPYDPHPADAAQQGAGAGNDRTKAIQGVGVQVFVQSLVGKRRGREKIPCTRERREERERCSHIHSSGDQNLATRHWHRDQLSC